MTEEVGGVRADPTYAEELTIGETLASVERVAGLKSEVVMGICGFGVKVNPQCAVKFKVNHGVEEGEMGGGDFEGELDCGMAGIEVVDKGKKGHEAMLPYKENVVYEPFPQEGQEVVCIDMEFLKSMHMGDCIVWGGSGAHSCATNLEEVATAEGEIVALEYELKKFDEGGVGGVLGSRSDGFKGFQSSLNSFRIGYISVEAADV